MAYPELEHELDLWLKKFYKHRPSTVHVRLTIFKQTNIKQTVLSSIYLICSHFFYQIIYRSNDVDLFYTQALRYQIKHIIFLHEIWFLSVLLTFFVSQSWILKTVSEIGNNCSI